MVRRKNVGANRQKCKSYDMKITSQILLVIYSVLYIVLNKNGMLTFAPTWDLIREALDSPLLVKIPASCC